jgi:hypothetical protein
MVHRDRSPPSVLAVSGDPEALTTHAAHRCHAASSYLMPSALNRMTSGASALRMNFGPVGISSPSPGKTP